MNAAAPGSREPRPFFARLMTKCRRTTTRSSTPVTPGYWTRYRDVARRGPRGPVHLIRDNPFRVPRTMRPYHRLSLPSMTRPAACLIAAVATLILAGCQKPTAQAEPPPPTVGVVESRRMTVPIMVTPNGTTRALEDVTIRARVRGFLTERHFRGGLVRQEGPAPAGHRRGAVQGRAQSARARLARGRGRPEEGRGVQGPRGRRGAAGARPGATRPRPGPEDEARALAADPQRRLDAEDVDQRPRPTARSRKPRSRPTAPTTSRRRPTTRSASSPPGPRSRRPRPPSATPSSTWATAGCTPRSTAAIGEAKVKVGNLVGPGVVRRRRPSPSWPPSSSSTRWASTSRLSSRDLDRDHAS